jgi:hypothetical protein
MRKTVAVLGTLVAMGAVAGAASAQTYAVDPGTQYSTAAMAGFSTYGEHMAGMVVTGYDGSGTMFTGTWGLTGGVWGVTTSLFSLVLNPNGDTWDTPWTLSATGGNLFRVVLSGAPGNTVFDRSSPSPGTPGSASGKDFQFYGTTDLWSTLVTYRNQVAVGGTLYGDLFETMDVQFRTNALMAGTNLRFIQDTDNAATGSPIIPDPTVVPEPITMALLGTGLAGIAAARRRRRVEETDEI